MSQVSAGKHLVFYPKSEKRHFLFHFYAVEKRASAFRKHLSALTDILWS